MRNTEIEKEQIIEAVKLEQDEWVLKAIKRLLDIDFENEMPREHLTILNERMADYKADPTNLLNWEDVKKDFSN